MEESFGINNVALVDGQPRVLGLRELLQVYVDHRIEVVRRRSEYRRRKRADRLHLVDGLLIALLNIDEVIQVIRASDDAAEAKERLIAGLRPVRDPGAVHPRHPAAPAHQIRPAGARARAGDPAERDRRTDRDPRVRGPAARGRLRRARRDRRAVRHAAADGAARGSAGSAPKTAAVPLEVADDPCLVLLSSTGLIARSALPRPLDARGRGARRRPAAQDGCRRQARRRAAGPRACARRDHRAAATARGSVGVVTSAGRLIRLGVLELPALPPSAHAPGLAGGAPLTEFVALDGG